jgi:hypothetical protein
MSSSLADELGRRDEAASAALSVALASTAPAVARPAALDSRTRLLLEGSIVPTLLRLAWPNILVMLAQSLDRPDRDLVGLASWH